MSKALTFRADHYQFQPDMCGTGAVPDAVLLSRSHHHAVSAAKLVLVAIQIDARSTYFCLHDMYEQGLVWHHNLRGVERLGRNLDVARHPVSSVEAYSDLAGMPTAVRSWDLDKALLCLLVANLRRRPSWRSIWFLNFRLLMHGAVNIFSLPPTMPAKHRI